MKKHLEAGSMKKHTRKNLVGFKTGAANRPECPFPGDIVLAVQRQLGNPDQHINDNNIFNDGGKTVGTGKSKITHGANLTVNSFRVYSK